MKRYKLQVTEMYDVYVDADTLDQAKEFLARDLPKYKHDGLNNHRRRHRPLLEWDLDKFGDQVSETCIDTDQINWLKKRITQCETKKRELNAWYRMPQRYRDLCDPLPYDVYERKWDYWNAKIKCYQNELNEMLGCPNE